MKKRVLFADDEIHYKEIVENFLNKNNIELVYAKDGLEAVEIFSKDPDFDLVILDIMMPNLDGRQTLEEIKYMSDVPVIMLTALDEEIEEVKALNIGADDYITKPFSYPVFIARIKRILKRQRDKRENIINELGLKIDLDKKEVYLEDEIIKLTPNEYKLLIYLSENKDITLSRDMIAEACWGFDYDGDLRNVDTFIKRLRKKLKSSGSKIKTVYGFGYRVE